MGTTKPTTAYDEAGSFHSKPWSERFRTLGAPSEEAFVSVALENGWQVERMGYRAVSFDTYELPHFIRFMPDYLVSSSEGLSWIECLGTKDLEHVKYKIDKRSAQRLHYLFEPHMRFFVLGPGDVFQLIEGVTFLLASYRPQVEAFWDGNLFVRVPLEKDRWQFLP